MGKDRDRNFTKTIAIVLPILENNKIVDRRPIVKKDRDRDRAIFDRLILMPYK